jgi:hypothetical protein
MTHRQARLVVLAMMAVLASVSLAQTPPVTIDECIFTPARNAHLAWTNGAENYGGIQLSIDGLAVPESPLPGTTTSYDSAQLGPGNHTFTLRPFIGIAYAQTRSCTAAAALPPPTDLVCAAAPDAWAVHLSWTNAWVYNSMTIMRDGFLVTTLAGAPRTFTDAIPAPGAYHYEIFGTLSGFDSAAVVCDVESTFVPPVALASAAFAATRIATLTWTNGAASYQGIELSIDGVAAPQSPLPGGAQKYDSAALAPGPHTFALRPFIGTYRAAAVETTIDSPLPPPSQVRCTPATDAWTVGLAWTNEWTYDGLVVTRDDQTLASLPGNAAEYRDTLTGPGQHTYAVHAVLNGQASLAAACTADDTYVPVVALAACALGADRVARLSWANGASTYTEIRLFIDGAAAPQSPLPGTATAFESAALAPGAHTFALRPCIGAYVAPPTECAATAILPEPSTLTCAVAPDTWRVELRWTNGWSYEQVAVVRNGERIATLDGAAASLDDDVPALGTYAYAIFGIRGAQDSLAAACTIQVDGVPPVTAAGCDVALSAVAHLSWTNGDARYQGIDILIDDVATADSPLAPDATSYDSVALAPGPHRFAIRPFAGATVAAPATCAADAPPPPPAGLECRERAPFWNVALAWTDAFVADSLRITRNGNELATLPGDAATFTDAVAGPGTYAYEVYAVFGPRESARVACTVDITFVPPVALDSCAIDESRVARLAWKNGAANYGGIEVLIDGAPAPESPLAGDALAYTSAPFAPGSHTLALRPFIGAFQAQAAECSDAAVLPGPTALACVASDLRWETILSWTSGWPYGSVTVVRDGVPVATLSGAPESYVDPVPGLGVYAYDVYGSLGAMTSLVASCTAVVSTVPPVVIDRCECDAGRSAHIAWTNAIASYDAITILIDGAETADSPLPGTATSYDSIALDAGPHTIAVRAALAGERSSDARCSALAPVPPPAGMVCAPVAGAWAIDVSWTNAWAYESVTILRNGAAVATIPGPAASYRDDVPAPGAYAYVVAGNLGDQSANAAGCIVRVTFIPPPQGIACTTLGMRAHVAWTDPIAYDAIQVFRDGEQIAALSGSATSYDDTLADVLPHQYAVVGTLGTHASANAVCSAAASDAAFVRGDVNADAVVNIADAVSLLNYLFRSGKEPACLESANLNDDAAVNIADVIYSLGYLFRSDKAPKAPFPSCGSDPTPGGTIDCKSFGPCGH